MNLPNVTIVTSGELACQRCAGPALLAVRVPADDPHHDTGHTHAQLCRSCDVDQPEAQGLLAFLAFYDTISVEHADEFHQLLSEWVRRRRDTPRPQIDPRDFDADVDAWMRGDFD